MENSRWKSARQTLERFFDRASLKKDKPRHRYKHTIEPDITFRYVGGVNDFQRFIRFDSDATLSNTSENRIRITQRLFLKSGDDQPKNSFPGGWFKKHYFDPTFSVAPFVDGQRNVLQALNPLPRSRSPSEPEIGRRSSATSKSLRAENTTPSKFSSTIRSFKKSRRSARSSK